MKTRTLSKKLVLHKTTISSLNNGSMDDVKGGTASVTCDTCLTPGGGTNCIACPGQYTTYGGICVDCY
jgi:hypothetical protein